MTSSRNRDREAVARSFLEYVRANGRGGNWVHGIVAYRAAAEECRELEWARYAYSHPGARIGLTADVRRLMQTEFRDIEREKRPSRWVFFKVKGSHA